MWLLTMVSCSRTSSWATSSPSSSVVSVKPRISLKKMVMVALSDTSGVARGPLPSPCAFSFIPRRYRGTKNSSRCVDKTTRLSKRLLAALPSDDAPRLEVEPRQAPGRDRGDFQPDPESRPESFAHRRHTGGVVQLHQDPHLVELSVLEDLDLELLD